MISAFCMLHQHQSLLDAEKFLLPNLICRQDLHKKIERHINEKKLLRVLLPFIFKIVLINGFKFFNHVSSKTSGFAFSKLFPSPPSLPARKAMKKEKF